MVFVQTSRYNRGSQVLHYCFWWLDRLLGAGIPGSESEAGMTEMQGIPDLVYDYPLRPLAFCQAVGLMSRSRRKNRFQAA